MVEIEELRKQPDEVVFAFAQAEGRVVVTEDIGGFITQAADALRSGQSHCSLILTAPRTFPRSAPRTYGQFIRALDALLTSDADISGREVWLRPA